METALLTKCQTSTEDDSRFICKEFYMQTGYKSFQVTKKQCLECSANKASYLDELKFNFYLSVLAKEEFSFLRDDSISFFQTAYASRPHITKEYVHNYILNYLILPAIYKGRYHRTIYYLYNNIDRLLIGINANEISKDEDKIFNLFENFHLKAFKLDKFKAEGHISRALSSLSIDKKYVMKFAQKHVDILSPHFLNHFDGYIGEYDKKMAELITASQNPHKKVSLVDKILGIKEAFSRGIKKAKEEGVSNIWVDEREAVERQICCSMCTDGNSCPYCGCQISKSWFLPLGKSDLATEGCPNKKTYPHLKKFPPKNYWDVCNEMSSILVKFEGSDSKKLNSILNKLVDNASGKIEILVNCDFELNDLSLEITDIVRFQKDGLDEPKGDYIFNLEQCHYDDFGYDTKLKYDFLQPK